MARSRRSHKSSSGLGCLPIAIMLLLGPAFAVGGIALVIGVIVGLALLKGCLGVLNPIANTSKKGAWSS